MKKGYHHGDLPRAALDAARTHLARSPDGSAATLSLRAIARDLGVSHRALYRHFEDRRALLVALAIQGLERLTTQMQAELAALDPDSTATLDGMRAIIRAYITFGLDASPEYLVIFGPRLNADERHPELEDAISACVGVVQSVFEAGIQRDELRPHDTFAAALTLWSAVHGYTHLAIMRRWNVRDESLPKWGQRALEPMLVGLLDAYAKSP